MTSDKPEFVEWWCKKGHRERQREDCVEVWCAVCGRDPMTKTDVRMRRKDLFPTWGLPKMKEAM